jgi:hypothetical protein
MKEKGARADTYGDHLGEDAEYGAEVGEVGDWLKLGEVGE